MKNNTLTLLLAALLIGLLMSACSNGNNPLSPVDDGAYKNPVTDIIDSEVEDTLSEVVDDTVDNNKSKYNGFYIFGTVTSSIEGSLTDQVEVTLTSRGFTCSEYTTTTDDNGFYQINELYQGGYSIKFYLAGHFVHMENIYLEKSYLQYDVELEAIPNYLVEDVMLK